MFVLLSKSIGLTFHTHFVNPVVSACVSTVGIYAACNALSPEEPRHYNQHTNENYDQQNRDLTLWRFGFRVRYKVRDHVGHGGTAIFHNVFPKCDSQCSLGVHPRLRPLSSRSLKRTVHVCRMSDPTDHPWGTRGTQPLG